MYLFLSSSYVTKNYIQEFFYFLLSLTHTQIILTVPQWRSNTGLCISPFLEVHPPPIGWSVASQGSDAFLSPFLLQIERQHLVRALLITDPILSVSLSFSSSLLYFTLLLALGLSVSVLLSICSPGIEATDICFHPFFSSPPYSKHLHALRMEKHNE